MLISYTKSFLFLHISRTVCKQIGIVEKLPHKNKIEHKHYREYYTDESKEVITQLCKHDLEVFGYEF
jgi:hypothetical protein